MEDQQTCNLLVAVLFFLGDTVEILWVVSVEMNEKNPFLYTSFLFLTKTHNDPDFFYLILDFNKETHP